MATMYRPPSLENKDIMGVYGRGRQRYFVKEEDCISEECDVDSESSEEDKSSRNVRSSVSLEIYGLQREQQVHFSNQEYYRRLEELKSTHLRNMAELERMYISQEEDGHRGGEEEEEEEEDGDLGRKREGKLSVSGPARRLQRINSQEELDFHETSSGSDQSDLSVEDSVGEMNWTSSQETAYQRNVLLRPEQNKAQKHSRFQSSTSCPKLQGRTSLQTGSRIRSGAKVTVPKPFAMMLREEERKRHKVRTRSEIELENTLLKRELDELRECQKKFRASPAPAHIHLPLYQVISSRTGRRSDRSNRGNGHGQREACGDVSPRPFVFLERERRKREARIEADFGNFAQRVEPQTFKARPVPSSVYGYPPAHHRAKAPGVCRQEREPTEGQSESNSDPETDLHQSDSVPDSVPDSRGPLRCPPAKKKQLEVSIELVKETEWSHSSLSPPLPPPQDAPLLLISDNSDCISV